MVWDVGGLGVSGVDGFDVGGFDSLDVDGVGVGGLGVDSVGVDGFRGDGGSVSLIGLGGGNRGGEGDAGKDAKVVSKGVESEFYCGERC